MWYQIRAEYSDILTLKYNELIILHTKIFVTISKPYCLHKGLCGNFLLPEMRQ